MLGRYILFIFVPLFFAVCFREGNELVISGTPKVAYLTMLGRIRIFIVPAIIGTFFEISQLNHARGTAPPLPELPFVVAVDDNNELKNLPRKKHSKSSKKKHFPKNVPTKKSVIPNYSMQFIATSAEVTPKGSLARESDPQNGRNIQVKDL